MAKSRRLCDSCGTKNLWGPRPTPIVKGKKIFTLGARGNLFCLDAVKGKILWQKLLANKDKDSGFTPSPLIEGDLLINPCIFARSDEELVCASLASGT